LSEVAVVNGAVLGVGAAGVGSVVGADDTMKCMTVQWCSCGCLETEWFLMEDVL